MCDLRVNGAPPPSGVDDGYTFPEHAPHLWLRIRLTSYTGRGRQLSKAKLDFLTRLPPRNKPGERRESLSWVRKRCTGRLRNLSKVTVWGCDRHWCFSQLFTIVTV